MATVEDFLAAADRAKAAGNAVAEKSLRDRAAVMSAGPNEYRAAAERALAAGNKPAYEALMSRVPVSPPKSDAAGPPQAPAEQWEDWSQYPQDANKTSDRMIGQDEFGDTIWETLNGTRYVRTKTTSAPSTKKAAEVTLGDVGEAAGNLATGIGQMLVQGVTAPSRALRGEVMTPSDAMATAALAIPGAPRSARASVAPAVAPRPAQMPSLVGDVAAARELGIPVMRTDVKPPTTAVGKIAQRAGEGIPFAGTAGPRAAQNAARVEAARNFVKQYGADIPESAIPDVAASVLEKQSNTIREFGGKKTAIVNSVKGKGPVPVPGALAEIDRQIAALEAQRLPELAPVVAKLRGWRDGLEGQPLDVLEKNRQDLGQMFAAPELAGVRTRGEKAISAIYGPLRSDIEAFVKSSLGDTALATWKEANGRISFAMNEAKNSALKNVLNKGEATPETVRSLLFSTKPSDMQRLYRSLTPEGQSRARTAIIQEALGKAGGMDALSPEKFKSALARFGGQIGVFFKGDDLNAATGLQRALKLTEHASVAGAAPLTGVQNMPAIIGTLVGTMTGSLTGTAAVLGGLGGLARVYEATGVQRALKYLGRARTPLSERAAIKALDDALRDAGIAVGQGSAVGAANTQTQPRIAK